MWSLACVQARQKTQKTFEWKNSNDAAAAAAAADDDDDDDAFDMEFVASSAGLYI